MVPLGAKDAHWLQDHVLGGGFDGFQLSPKWLKKEGGKKVERLI